MTRLQTYRNGIAYELDAPDQSIELNFQSEDLRSPGSRLAPFSLTFGLPFTDRNKTFFGFVDELSLQDSGFNMLRKTEAKILDNGVEVLEGVLQLKNVDLRKQLFNCSFYSSTVDFFQTIRGKRWREIWTDALDNIDCPLDHTLNSTNVLSAWAEQNIAGTDPTLVPNGTIQYPLTDNGNAPFAGYQVRADALTRWGGTEGLIPTNLHPAIKVTWLLDAMLQYAGYTRTAEDWFNNTLLNNDNLYVHVGLQSKTVDTRGSFGFRATTTVTTVGTDEYLLTNFDTTTTPNYDPDGLFTSGTYVEFNLIGTYVIDVNIFNPNNQGGQWNSDFIAFNASGSEVITFPFVAGQADNGDGINLTINIPFSGSPELWYFAIETSLSATFIVTVEYVDLIGATAVDGVLDFATIMGEEPLDKWVKGLVETYNLVLKFDEQQKTATFIPYDDFVKSGRTLDWTDRIDVGGDMKMYPATEYQKSRVEFLPAETQDHRSIYFESLFGVRKGQYEYITRNDFATGVYKLNDFFGLARLTYLKWQTNPANGQTITTSGEVSTSIIIRELWKSAASYETEYESLPPMLLYYHGIQSTLLDLGGTSYDLKFADGTVFTYAPLMTPVSGVAADPIRISLEYAVTATDLANVDVIGNPTSGLFQTYWNNYIESIYGASSRILECKLLLSPIDIYRLDFGDEILIQNISYRLLAINNYVVGEYAPVSATLFKASQGNLYDCDLFPTIGPDGLITWQDEEQSGTITLASGQVSAWLNSIAILLDLNATFLDDGIQYGDTLTHVLTGETLTVWAAVADDQLKLVPTNGSQTPPEWILPGESYTITRGTPIPGNALCCQAYGWIWNETTGQCSAVGRRTRDTYGFNTGFASSGTRANSLGICQESARVIRSNYLEGDVIEERWEMIATTTDSNATAARTLQLEQIDFLVGAERTCNIQVTWMAVQTSGVNKGTATSGEEATLINTVSATSSAFPGTIYTRGATGLGVSILTSDGSDGSKWKINCSGLPGVNVDWFISVTAQEYDQSALNIDVYPYAEFQDQDIYLFQDGDTMIWNA
jgi:hypothetical protein